MKLLFVVQILFFFLIADIFDAMPLKKGPSWTLTGGMKGEFKRCLNGVCHKVFELLFEHNPCFEYKNEVGVSFFINEQKYAGQLNEEYDILDTNCTIDAVDRTTDAIGLYNFINDKYDKVYFVLLAAAKIIIGILAFFLFKISKRTKSNYHLFMKKFFSKI